MLDLSEKQVITEQDLKTLSKNAKVQFAENAIITPLARDLINSLGLEITRRPGKSKKRTVAVSADHGGFEMKEALKELLKELGVEHHDFGTYDTKAVDYPDYAFMVASGVSEGKFSLGIIIDGAGIGSCMVANKLPNVRAAMATNVALARNSREHNDANVLTLGGKMISIEEMKEIVKVWLNTSITEERHLSRVAKIVNIERQYIKK
jgi:ribose 5-phosphate isomerase B